MFPQSKADKQYFLEVYSCATNTAKKLQLKLFERIFAGTLEARESF